MNSTRPPGEAISTEKFFGRLFADADARDERPLENRRYSPEDFFAHIFGDSPEHGTEKRGPAQHPAGVSAPHEPTARIRSAKAGPLAFELEIGRDGRVVRKQETAAGRRTTWEYAYDGSGRLIAVSRDGVLVEEYAYDTAGRRTTACTEATAMLPARYAYDGDRLLLAGEESFQYAAGGGLAASRDSRGETRYMYEANGGLGRVNLPDGRVVAYLLNNLGQPLEKYVDGKRTERFRWIDALRLGAYRDLERGIDMHFHYGDGRTPHSVVIADGQTEQTYALGYDQVGTLKAVADRHGNLIQAIQYDSFGSMLHDTTPSLFIPIGFAGGLRDRHTGLVRFVNRDYAPRTGRFTAPDPLGDTGGDHDLYEYCVDDPVNAEDPWGYQSKEIPGAKEAGKAARRTDSIGTRLDGVLGIYERLENANSRGDHLEAELRQCMHNEDIDCLDKISQKRKKTILQGSSDVVFDACKAITGLSICDWFKSSNMGNQ